ncbi:MAG: hypothetical protein ACP5IL_12790 [Syntrophobacteraceae bacterium]
MKLIFHPDADAELTEAARYYESCQPDLGSDINKSGGLPENRQKSPA